MRIERFLNELCIFKDRASSTENEHRAAKHIYQIMRSFGLAVSIDEFKSVKRYTWELMLITSFFLIQAVIYFFYPIFSLIFGIVGLILFWGNFTTRFKPLAPLFKFSKSNNVVGKYQNPDATFKVILTAHYDTARSGPMWDPKNVSKFRFNFLLSFYAILVLLIFSTLNILNINNLIFNVIVVLIGIYITGQIIVLLFSGLTGKPVEGASDNASGVAVMLDLAARLKEMSCPEIEFWFVATGSEEVGALGMTDFLKTYSEDIEKDNTYFINFDNIGSGNLHYYVGEGMLNFYKFSRELISAARKTAEQKDFKSVTSSKYKLAYTDSIVPTSRGFKAILFLATDDKDQIPNWHWHTDTLENIDYSVPQLASDFCMKMIGNLQQDFKQILNENKKEMIKLQEEMGDTETL